MYFVLYVFAAAAIAGLKAEAAEKSIRLDG